MDFSVCVNDDTLGPGVEGCREDFDFTRMFENVFFSILPCAVFALASTWRLVFLVQKARCVTGAWFQFVKLIAIVIYASLRLALLLVGVIQSSTHNASFVASLVLELLAAFCAAALSFVEHFRSPRPSILLEAFLLLTLLFDICQTRSIWLSAQSYYAATFARILCASTAWKFALILLETKGKRQWIIRDVQSYSPEETSGLYRLLTLSWLNDLLSEGYRKILTVSDLYPLKRSVKIETLHEASHNLVTSSFQGRKNGLARVLGKTLSVSYLLPVIPRLAQVGFTVCQPLLIESLLIYLDQPVNASRNTGYGLIGATVIIYSGLAISQALYEFLVQHALSKARACLLAALYEKTTKIKASAAGKADSLTLMSTDIERLQIGFREFHEFWAITLQGAVACYFLYRHLGAVTAAPLVLIAICAGASAGAMSKAGPRQNVWMEMIQQRVATTAKIVGNMKNIKMSGLAPPVERSLQDLRVKELHVGNRYRTVSLIVATIGYVPMLVSPLFTFALTTHGLDSKTIFPSMAYIYLLTEPLMSLFQYAPLVVTSFTCLQRIQNFLEQETWCDFRQWKRDAESSSTLGSASDTNEKVSISVINCSFGWEKENTVLRDINAAFTRGLNMVTGPVGSGKSTLCKALLGEVPCTQGEIIMSTDAARIGFCDQTPFLQNASIKENIIGFSMMDQARYSEVVEATMLDQDVLLLPQGHNTKIGSAGTALSGGQKQRVSIARALYQHCNVFVFDDVLGGLDADTEKHVFARVFGPDGLLKKRCVTTILCTHGVHNLRWADQVISLSAAGSLVKDDGVHELMEQKEHIQSSDTDDSSQSSISNTSVLCAAMPEEKTNQEAAASPELADSISEPDSPNTSRALRDPAVFMYYFKRIGLFWTLSFILAGIAFGFLFNFSTIWLKYWSADISAARPARSTPFYAGIFALLQCLTLTALSGAVGIGMLTLTKISGSKIHETTIQTVAAAPLRFFTTTDAGIVVNLFSQDMTIIDNELPLGLINTNVMGWITVGAAAVAATTSPYIIVTYPFLIAVVYFIQKFYLRTSRQLRLLDLEMKSPLYTNFMDTINGIVTIRAFGWIKNAMTKNDALLNTSQSPSYLLRMTQRWLTLVLGLVVALLAAIVVTLATQLRTAAGFAGASMLSVMTVGTNIALLVQMFLLLEISMGTLNRLKTFSETTPSENLPGEEIVPSLSWPEKGRIDIKDVSASYSHPLLDSSSESGVGSVDDKTIALRDLNIAITPGSKVAICGRTGSGKSSIVLLLLRMLEPVSSCDYDLSIDGISLNTIDRTALRERLIVIPQEPVFLPYSATSRTNLDPTGTAPDSECEAALHSVGLWSVVQERGGLDAELDAESLSQGHRQLFSLAKAILRRHMRSRARISGLESSITESQIAGSPQTSGGCVSSEREKEKIAESDDGADDGGLLILDEFNSSLDLNTDRLMQEIIRDEFAGYTILMVSHRLQSIMHFDEVILMDKGRVAERGSPQTLSQQEGSRFRDLCMAREVN